MNKKEQNKAPEKKKFSFSQIWADKRLRSIFLSACVILLCVVVYVVLILTVLKPVEEEERPTVGNHGEQMANGMPFVVDPIDTDLIQSIRVNNEYGGFHYYQAEDGKFYFEGAEALLYDESAAWMDEDATEEDVSDVLNSFPMTESLLSFAGYMLAAQEVEGYDRDHLSNYGLEDEGKASMTVTYLDDDGNEASKTVYFGNQTLAGASYYCMAEGRDAVYIMTDSYISRCIFTELKSYISPQVSPAISSTVYSEVKDFSIRKNGKKFLSIRHTTDEEFEDNGQLFTHIFTSPEGYYPSMDNFYSLLETFTDFTGNAVMEFGLLDRLNDPAQSQKMTEMFRLYSLMDQNNEWVYQMDFSYEGFETTLYISEKLEVLKENAEEEEEKTFIYYIYSPDFDVIVEFNAEDLPWVEWDLLTFMDSHSYAVSIDNASSLSFQYEGVDVKFSIQGEGDGLKVSSSTGISVDADNFRQLYKAILFTTTDGYADQPDDATKILSLQIALRDGTRYEYEFFGLTARKAYYTLNGSGQFYINRDYVKQMMSACNGILKGETVTVEKKN